MYGPMENNNRFVLQIHVGLLSLHYEALSVEASKQTTAEEIINCITERLGLISGQYELAEVVEESKERRLAAYENPVLVMLLWPLQHDKTTFRFYLREIQSDVPWLHMYPYGYGMDSSILRNFIPLVLNSNNREYPDLCQLPDLSENILLENLKRRFEAGHIYTYVGNILIAVNPFKFHPIYNPKYVRLYQNHRIGPTLPPHIFAIADNAYYSMLEEKRNQCIVISGESGSGKTESTNFLLHHLTALSQKGCQRCGLEQIILSAGPVLEAFGNAKTAHNNNSSRFGKFIQVKYKENGVVQGAVVQKYLLEKSRITSQGSFERNYHVFYYLLFGANEKERESHFILPTDSYNYLNCKNIKIENTDERYEFSRLKQSMEMVGFSDTKQRRVFSVLSAVLHIGNVEFVPKRGTYHHDESVQIRNFNVITIISRLLNLRKETLLTALTSKKVRASEETVVMQYKLQEAVAARDALAKCLYSALFDWIVLQINFALLTKDYSRHVGKSIGVLDIFGFEDFGSQNSFEQLCINYANEHLQYYFNLHVFKFEQNEYKREGIIWTDIEFSDNSECLHLFESKPSGLLCILDDLCSLAAVTNETLIEKFNATHKDNRFYEKTQKQESAFIINHYAGSVKYKVTDMKEKNLDLMRQDIVSVLKSSSSSFVKELVAVSSVALFRWGTIRAFFRAVFVLLSFKKHPGSRNTTCKKHYFLLRKCRSYRVPNRNTFCTRNLESVKMVTVYSQPAFKIKKQLTVTAQFQLSLSSLMETLNQANPYFIRCIKSNLYKMPNKFDESTVARQLKYTGMLETVRIRRAGYNVRISYSEFTQLYRVLLPKGMKSSTDDIKDFLNLIDLNKQHYQLGNTKIYMRESQKIQLDIKLHTKIINSIRKIQKWFRKILKAKRYVVLYQCALTIQRSWKKYTARKKARVLKLEHNAAIIIQRNWQMYKIRKWYKKLKHGCIIVQANIRGYNARQRLKAKKLISIPLEIKKPVVKKGRNLIKKDINHSVTVPNKVLVIEGHQQNERSKKLGIKRRPDNKGQIGKDVIKNDKILKEKSSSKFSTTREYTDSTDRIISDAKELRVMQDFITQKIYKMDTNATKCSEVDMVFKQALKEFNENLVAQYSVANKQDSGVLNIKYRDLIANFERVIETTAVSNNGFPLTMGVNAFRGFMNEFMGSRDQVKLRIKQKKDKKKKDSNFTVYNGHVFQLTIINIATACEICQLFLLWPIERGHVCLNCRLTCHKKCLNKTLKCNKISLHYNGKQRLFGVPLAVLCYYSADKCILPQQIEELFCKIEIHGLYSEGLYRKSAVSSKIKDLKEKLESGLKNIDIDVYNVHVLANTLKLFLREMSEPLLSFDLYDDFLRAADLDDNNDRIQTIISLTKNLQSSHQILFERLIFHLALVAYKEQYNRMSTSSLAIVFAPCILRTSRCIPAQESLYDIGRQTKCIEALIVQKMQNIKNTLNNIDTLDIATNTASEKLLSLRCSKSISHVSELRSISNAFESNAEEMLLEGHIEELIKEKTQLTLNLPNLMRTSSDDDLLSTDVEYDNESLDDFKDGYKKHRKLYKTMSKDLAEPDDNLVSFKNENNFKNKNCEFGYCIDKIDIEA